MKIAIPTAGGKLCMHFGHCEKFALVETDEKNGTILKTDLIAPPAHEPGILPRWLYDQGVDLVIAGGVGRRAQSFFNGYGIEMVVGAPAESPEAIIESYMNGSLEIGENVCDH